ncbi:aminotransferase class III-fold pyridoxal phosphate-dependent enzyme [Arcanobacterium hippocoleae]
MIERAKEVIPGGVQHNLAFNYPFPLAFSAANGIKLRDIDGNEYFDFLQAGGPTVLGSNPESVREKVIALISDCGPSTGLFHEYEAKLARLISELIPTVDKFRMLGSGTEACMAAVRIARLATGHKHVLKMGGAYHGWSDSLGYGIRIPGSKFTQAHGVPRAYFRYTDEFFPGSLESLERKLKLKQLHGGTAAIMIEPIGPESGTRPVDKEFLAGTAQLARRYGALLIFDEVVTAFRISEHGAQGYFGISPDLTVFGKVIAGGYPGAGGIGGKDEYMKYLGAGLDGSQKVKKAFVGGTLAATPISALAGYYTIKEIAQTDACRKAGEMGDRITVGLRELIRKYHLPFVAFNQESVCHLETVGTMHFAIDWKKPWKIPEILRETSVRKKKWNTWGRLIWQKVS